MDKYTQGKRAAPGWGTPLPLLSPGERGPVGGHAFFQMGLHGRPVLARDAKVDTVTNAPTGHHHMVAKRPFLDCPNTRERLA